MTELARSPSDTAPGTSGAVEERVRICGLDVHVSIRPAPGDAPPLLLLMGVGGNTAMWPPTRELVGAGRTTIAFDVPGTGVGYGPTACGRRRPSRRPRW